MTGASLVPGCPRNLIIQINEQRPSLSPERRITIALQGGFHGFYEGPSIANFGCLVQCSRAMHNMVTFTYTERA